MSKTNLFSLFSKEPVNRFSSTQASKGKDIVFTEWPLFNQKLGGLHNGDLIVVSGLSASGKTTFVHNLIRHICVENGYPSLFFSFQTSEADILRNMVSAIGKIPYQSLLGDASLSEEQNSLVEKIKHDVTQAPIYMCHEELDSDALCTLAEKYVRLHGIKAIVIDGLCNIMGVYFNNYTKEAVFHSLKAMALRLGVPIIVTHTIKTYELCPEEGCTYPKLDLADNNPVYEIADVIILINCPDDLGIKVDERGNNLTHMLVVSIEKNSHAARHETAIMRYDFSIKSIWEDPSAPQFG